MSVNLQSTLVGQPELDLEIEIWLARQ